MKYSSKAVPRLNMAAWRLFCNWEPRGSRLVQPDRREGLTPAVSQMFMRINVYANWSKTHSLIHCNFFCFAYSFTLFAVHFLNWLLSKDRTGISLSNSLFPWFTQLFLWTNEALWILRILAFEVRLSTSFSPSLWVWLFWAAINSFAFKHSWKTHCMNVENGKK